MSGEYYEIEWIRSNDADKLSKNGEKMLNEAEWNHLMKEIDLKNTGMKKVSELKEEEDKFYVRTVLEANDDKIKIATVSWHKKSYNDWWDEAKTSFSINIKEPYYIYRLPAINVLSSCLETDVWSPIPSCATNRMKHTAIWTGTEMIIWGGLTGNSQATNADAMYDPVANQWKCISSVGAPDAREGHTAVWTGSKMIIWGGNSASPGGIYDPAADQWSPISTQGTPFWRSQHAAVWTGRLNGYLGRYRLCRSAFVSLFPDYYTMADDMIRLLIHGKELQWQMCLLSGKVIMPCGQIQLAR